MCDLLLAKPVFPIKTVNWFFFIQALSRDGYLRYTGYSKSKRAVSTSSEMFLNLFVNCIRFRIKFIFESLITVEATLQRVINRLTPYDSVHVHGWTKERLSDHVMERGPEVTVFPNGIIFFRGAFTMQCHIWHSDSCKHFAFNWQNPIMIAFSKSMLPAYALF